MTDPFSPSTAFHETRSPLLQLPNTYRAFYGGFAHVRPVQKEVIGPILEGRDLVLQSATGSGKTEAVLAPCIERVIRSGREDALLYVVPTRALAIDLERRFAPVLIERLGLQLGIRTGDLKRAGGGRPDLILTTPESLDVLLGSSNSDLQHFVRRVRMVIIDEVHPLLHQCRGKQLAHLLDRLERRTGRPVQRIALSATIADVDAVIRFFGFRPDAVRLISAVQRHIVPHLVHLKREDAEIVSLLDDLHTVWGYGKILIFANSRGQCDQLFALTSQQGSFRGATELHYSNLKPKERRAAEDRFRSRHHSLCIATGTLELGIDVGDVDGVLLFEPPDSVSAFLQRIGRSNRRQSITHFWGVCRGERAGDQLLRFLGLLRLARRGVVETPLPNPFPSVLIQQVLSCLYEKKTISLHAMRDLFPQDKDSLEPIFSSMESQGWLRRDRPVSGRSALLRKIDPLRRKRDSFHGGWRYRNAFLDRLIWSNFPETEEDYLLEISGEAVADLPRSIVRQLDPGDRVHLAGRRIRVLQIDDSGERKRVLAEPAEELDDKELWWLGAAFHVSFEVAQSVRTVLDSSEEPEEKAGLGLFARTRRLLRRERSKKSRVVTLANGIQVLRESNGFYRYRTFLGSMGNVILRFTIERDLGALDDLFVSSDEMGIICSHWIDFTDLHLPLDRNGFRRLVMERLRPLRTLLPLNAYAHALPEALLIEELTGFLFDSRVAEHFARYRSSPSEIVSGDPRALELPLAEPKGPPQIFLQPSASGSLLDFEKERRRIHAKESRCDLPADARHLPRALTGTMIGEYMRHRQCERWLSVQFLPTELRPSMRAGPDAELEAVRTERGRQHEKRVLDFLREAGAPISTIEAMDGQGRQRSLTSRFRETLDRLKSLILGIDPEKPFYVSQAALRAPALLRSYCDRDLSSFAQDSGSGDRDEVILDQIEGIGIPDLIRISMRGRTALLEVGDIKDSAIPYYSQKWQVAFYALLLEECLRSGLLPVGAEVSHTGFLILRPSRGASAPVVHPFDLQPFMAAFPALFQRMADLLLSSPARATCRLQGCSPSCPAFENCYQEALEEEEIQFLPGMSEGALLKMRQLGLKAMEDAEEWFQKHDAPHPFSPHQRERLVGSLKAMRANRIDLRKSRTRLFPFNLSAAVFVHLVQDPVLDLPRVLAFRAVDEAGNLMDAASWTLTDEEEQLPVWQAFSDRLLAIWRESVRRGKGPHVFHFGEKIRRGLRQWGELSGGANRLSFLWKTGSLYGTDLRHLLQEHFDFPAPGRLTLFALGWILGFLSQEKADDGSAIHLDPPESLFHDDPDPYVPHETWKQHEALRNDAVRRVESILRLEDKIWKWAHRHLESDFEQTEWEGPLEGSGKDTPAAPYVLFLEEEKRLREEDILALQEYSLEERMERFRAVGPLTFLEASLDEEGRFLYTFRIAPGNALSKFREDDFLRLAPVGSRDLQSGYPVILARYDPRDDRLSVLSRQGRLALSKRLSYSLEEDLTDWNHPKLVHVAQTVLESEREHPVSKLLSGCWSMDRDRERRVWVEHWLRTFKPASGLNAAQRRALELPFRKRLALVEGPPGTGKTHLLAWIIIALILHAEQAGEPLRVAVSALTHRAIDGVLEKIADLVNRHRIRDFPARVMKWGRWKEDEPSGVGRREESVPGDFRVQSLNDLAEIQHSRYLVLGSTGFGLYNLFDGRTGSFPRVFDWIVFDEASQVLVPQALLSLAHGKGRFLFLGDVRQLPPVVLGSYARPDEERTSPLLAPDWSSASVAGPSHDAGQSILAHLLERYGEEHRVRLDLSYRMNDELCAFPSRMWYDGALRAAPGNATSRLEPGTASIPAWSTSIIPPESFASADAVPPPADASTHVDRILDPERPVVLVLADHQGCHQKSDLEAEIVARLAFRLMDGYGLTPERIALVSPHRAQNNATANRLRELLGDSTAPLPVIDTVERVQGSERDVILYALTTSDPDHVMREFLNNPNRFNVAITRAKRKLIVVGSRAFFLAVPPDEAALRANRCFKEFLRFCRKRGSLYVWEDVNSTLPHE